MGNVLSKCATSNNAVLIGSIVGVLVDLVIQLLIPGSGIIEIILGFIGGIATGISVAAKCRSNTIKVQVA